MTGGRVSFAAAIAGATSSLLHAVEIESGGKRTVTFFGSSKRELGRGREPDVAVREAAACNMRPGQCLPAPELVACDPGGSAAACRRRWLNDASGHRGPRTGGSGAKWMGGLAESAARIHRVDRRISIEVSPVQRSGRACRSLRGRSNRKRGGKSDRNGSGPAPSYTEFFVHRDYHPSNVFW